MTFDEYLERRCKAEDCGKPIAEEAWFNYQHDDIADPRGILKGWVRDIWTQGYVRGFKAGFEAREKEEHPLNGQEV